MLNTTNPITLSEANGQAPLILSEANAQAPLIVACAVIHDTEKDMFLMGKRAAHKHNGGYWEFMGGKQDQEDKDIKATIEREIDEEIGVKGKAGEEVTRIVHSYINGPTVDLHFIEFTLPKNAEIKPDSEVYETVDWIKRNELKDLNLSEGDKLFANTLVK